MATSAERNASAATFSEAMASPNSEVALGLHAVVTAAKITAIRNLRICKCYCVGGGARHAASVVVPQSETFVIWIVKLGVVRENSTTSSSAFGPMATR